MKIKGFSFSEGNSKMGRVLSFSVSPIVTCNPEAPCFKDCYAVKLVRIRKNVREAYANNTQALMVDHRYNEFINAFCTAIDYGEFHLVRFNVSGDMFNYEYLNACCEVAKRNPEVKFLAFTKQYEVCNEAIKNGIVPANFNIVFSAWNEFKPENESSVPVAYFDDGKHKNLVPDYAITCNGDCQHCRKCFYLKNGEAVKFGKH